MHMLLLAINGFMISVLLFGASQAFASCEDCRKMNCSLQTITCTMRDPILKADCRARKSKAIGSCEFRRAACYRKCVSEG